MAISTLVPIATSLVTAEALGPGLGLVGIKSDGLLYKATDATGFTRVLGYTAESAAIGDTVSVFPGIDPLNGSAVAMECINSTAHPLTAQSIGNVCYVESYTTTDGTTSNVWTVAASSSNSVIAGIFRGFTGLVSATSGLAALHCAVQPGKQTA